MIVYRKVIGYCPNFKDYPSIEIEYEVFKDKSRKLFYYCFWDDCCGYCSDNNNCLCPIFTNAPDKVPLKDDRKRKKKPY